MKTKMSAVKFPSINEVAGALRNLNSGIDPNEMGDTDETSSVDVRLQVFPDGEWTMHTGDSSYDQDHRGFWGCSSLNGRRFDSVAMARDLIDQARDHAAQND